MPGIAINITITMSWAQAILTYLKDRGYLRDENDIELDFLTDFLSPFGKYSS